MKQYALLRYMFLFEPGTTWQHAFEFEKTLVDFLGTRGMEAQFVNVAEGGTGEKILLIKKKDMILPPSPPNAVGRPKTVAGTLRGMSTHTPKAMERDFKKGTLLKSKGYIRR